MKTWRVFCFDNNERKKVIEIIEGTPADIPALRKMLFETWHENFDSTLGENIVEEICNQSYCEEILALEIANDDLSFLVAHDARREIKKVIGHGLAYCKDNRLFIGGLFVDCKVQGRGTGRALYQALRDAHEDFDEIHLQVIESNFRARAFYDKLGFKVIGQIDEMLGANNVPSLKMALKL